MSSNTALDFVSKDCRNEMHNSCHGRWEGMGFEVICVCNCGHKKHQFSQKNRNTLSLVALRDEFCELSASTEVLLT